MTLDKTCNMYSVLSFFIFKPFYCLTETVQNLQIGYHVKNMRFCFPGCHTCILNVMTTFGWDCPKRPINRGLKMSAATEVGLNVLLKVMGTWTLWIRRQCSRNKLYGRGRPLPPLPLRPLPSPPTRLGREMNYSLGSREQVCARLRLIKSDVLSLGQLHSNQPGQFAVVVTSLFNYTSVSMKIYMLCWPQSRRVMPLGKIEKVRGFVADKRCRYTEHHICFHWWPRV